MLTCCHNKIYYSKKVFSQPSQILILSESRVWVYQKPSKRKQRLKTELWTAQEWHEEDKGVGSSAPWTAGRIARTPRRGELSSLKKVVGKIPSSPPSFCGGDNMGAQTRRPLYPAALAHCRYTWWGKLEIP